MCRSQRDAEGVRDQLVRRQSTVPHHLRQRAVLRRHTRRPAAVHRLLQREADPRAEATATALGRDGQELVPARRVRRPRRRHVCLHRLSDSDVRRPHPATECVPLRIFSSFFDGRQRLACTHSFLSAEKENWKSKSIRSKVNLFEVLRPSVFGIYSSSVLTDRFQILSS